MSKDKDYDLLHNVQYTYFFHLFSSKKSPYGNGVC